MLYILSYIYKSSYLSLMVLNYFWDYPQQTLVKIVQSKKNRKEQKKKTWVKGKSIQLTLHHHRIILIEFLY